MDIAGKSFLVTGGSGFIGTWVVQKLLEANAKQVRVFDKVIRPDVLPAQPSVQVVEGDITDPEALRSAMQGIEGVFHMAVLPLNPCTQDPRACLNINVVGTYTVAEAALDAGVKKLVFSSASSVYGDTLEVMDELHPLGARTMYGVSKVAGEYILATLHVTRGLDYIALRYMNVYGPGQTAGLMANTVQRVQQGEAPVVFGDGSQSFDFVFVEDIARANLLAMQSDLTNEAFNIGSGEEVTVRELVQRIIRLSGASVEPIFRTDQLVPMQRRVGSSEKAARMIEYRPSVSLDEGLRRVLDAAGVK